MTTTPNFDDLTPPANILGQHWDDYEKGYTEAARWGARHGWEQARQLWPEPIRDRPPTEADADSRNAVQVVTELGNWAPWDWTSSKLEKRPWLHTPRWQPRHPSLQEQALALLPYDPQAGIVTLNSVEVLKIRRALEQAGEGLEP